MRIEEPAVTTERTEASWHSSAELLVLHGVRLAGFATVKAVAERADLPTNVVDNQLGVLEGQGLVEHMAFGDASGWILTAEGKERDTELLREELIASGAESKLRGALDDFENTVNADLVRVITAWQLQSAAEQQSSSTAVLQELTELGEALAKLLIPLTDRLPRFSRYPRQFREALAQARSGDMHWVAGVGVLSCHTVWAELHQDLLSSLGRERTTGT